MSEFVFKKKFGQNFISDKNLLEAIADDAQIMPEDEVLEIGAGAGSLTKVLSARAKKVVAYEIDKTLEQTLNSLNLANVEFVFQDFLGTDMREVESKFGGKIKVVANLPYYITTPIIFKLLEQSTRLVSLTIMVQKEVAERICSKVGGKDYGILTVMTNFHGTPTIKRIVSRKMFYPEPNVDSAVLNILIEHRHEDVDKAEFFKFVKACFAMRRKTLQNNLSKVYFKDKLKSALTEEVLSRRAESFSLDELLEIYKALNFNKNP